MPTVEQLKAQLKALNDRRGGGGSKARWWPKDNHTIRLLPIDGQEEPYRTRFFHYLNKKPFYCPAQNDGQQCDICDLSDSLKAWDDDKPEAQRKADFKAGCNLEAGPKYYFPMVERKVKDGKTTNEAPQWWAISEAIFREVTALALKDENIEIHKEAFPDFEQAWDVLTNTAKAFDLDVDLRKAGNEDGKGNNKTFNVTVVAERKRETALSTDREEAAKLISSVPDFDSIEPALTTEDVSKALQSYLNSSAPASKVGGDGEERSAKAPETKVDDVNREEPAAGKKSVEEALDAMLKAKGAKKS